MSENRPESSCGMAPASDPAVRGWALYLGLAMTTGSMLLVQQFATRIFTVQFNSGLAFLAISVTFLGLGSAGVMVWALPRTFAPHRIPRLAPALALAWAVLLVAGVMTLVALDAAATSTDHGAVAPLPEQAMRVLAASLLMLPAMLCVGLVISLVLRAHAARVNRLYGADLAGGGIGCLLVLPLMRWVGGDQGIFAIGALAAVGAALLAHAHRRARTRLAAAGVALCLAVAPLANRNHALIDVRSHGTGLDTVTDWVLEDHEVRREWNEMSRLGFFPTRDDTAMYVRIDSSCQTTIPAEDPDRQRALFGATDFERLPHVLDRHRRYLEIGAGGGRGMVMAKASGSESITGVEINPGIVGAALAGFPGYGVASLVADPRHRLLVAEGRSFARSCTDRFDTVTITFIQTGAADASAAFALSEANLFTVEAFCEFMRLLADGGVFYVYRHGGNEMLRLLAMAREALAQLGTADPTACLYAARNQTNRAVLLISLAPFTTDELQRLDRAAADLGIEVLYSPSQQVGARPSNPFPARINALRAAGPLRMADLVQEYRQLAHDPRYESIERTFVTCADPAAFIDDYVVDIRATHDDRPYYFFQGLANWRDFGLYFDVAGVKILGGTVVLLFWMAAAFSVLVAALILLPLALRRGGSTNGGPRFAVVVYFAGIGLGYIAVQVSFIQRFVLFLGHPAYAFSVVLLSFLVCSGLGSLASDRLWRAGGLVTPNRAIAALVALLLAYNQVLPVVFASSAIGWPVAAKIVLSTALILPPAFLMGLFFPHGIRMVDAVAPQLTPWAWGVNSAASVLGSIFALTLAIHFGFAAAVVVAAGSYALLCAPAGWMLRRAGAAGSVRAARSGA